MTESCIATCSRRPKAPIAAETTARVVALACTAPPHQATHWTGRAMVKAIGISVGSVQRIWRAHKLQPHRLRAFKRSRDPSFVAKLTDIVYIDPPAHAVVLSIDEKSQIQALDRTQPGLPIKPKVNLGRSIWVKGRLAIGRWCAAEGESEQCFGSGPKKPPPKDAFLTLAAEVDSVVFWRFAFGASTFPLSAIHRRCDPNRPRASAAPALSATSLLIASDLSIGAMPQLVQG
jgi:hypothetical protein